MRQPSLVAVQHEYPTDPRRDLEPVLAKATRAVQDGGIAVLPEYFYKPTRQQPSPDNVEAWRFVEDRILEATETIDGALVATVPEVTDDGVYNTALVAEAGEPRLRQRKLRPTEPEREAGIQPHDGLEVATVQGARLGVFVCADVLALDLVDAMRALAPDVVAVPVLSPNRGDDFTRAARTSVFIARAWDLGAFVVKAGGFFEPGVAGRSLITAPWGLLAKAGDDFEACLLQAPYEEDKLARARDPFKGLGEG